MGLHSFTCQLHRAKGQYQICVVRCWSPLAAIFESVSGLVFHVNAVKNSNIEHKNVPASLGKQYEFANYSMKTSKLILFDRRVNTRSLYLYQKMGSFRFQHSLMARTGKFSTITTQFIPFFLPVSTFMIMVWYRSMKQHAIWMMILSKTCDLSWPVYSMQNCSSLKT